MCAGAGGNPPVLSPAAGAAPVLPRAGPQQLAGGKCLGRRDSDAAACFGVITGVSLSRFIRQPSVLVHACDQLRPTTPLSSLLLIKREAINYQTEALKELGK